MTNPNTTNGNEKRCTKGYPISNDQPYKQNITLEVALSLKGISVTAEGPNKTLENVIKEKLSSEYKITLLIHISHCLLRLETNPTPLDELLPSEIFIREKELANESIINIGKLAKIFYQVLTGRELSKVAYRHLVLENIKEVGKLLSKKDCDDPFTAQDLIQQMIVNKDFEIKDVLLHPFFWSELDKIMYICKIYDRIVPECDIQSKPELRTKTKIHLEKYGIDDNENCIIPDEGWIEKLIIPRREVIEMEKENPGETFTTDMIRGFAFKSDENPSSAIKIDIVKSDRNPSCPIEIKNSDENPSSSIKIVEEMHNKKTSCALNIEMGKSDESITCPITVEIEKSETKISCAIKIDKKPSTPIKKKTEKSDANKIAIFDKKSIFDLIRFFRNRHAHYWENDKRIRIAFGDYSDGYWNFYYRRFPNLLIHVYRSTKCFFENDDFSKSIAPLKYLQKK